MSDAEIERRGVDLNEARAGVLIGFPTEADLEAAFAAAGEKPKR